MTTYAAALWRHALLALFPFVIFLVALLGFLQVPDFFDWILEQARTAIPADGLVGQGHPAGRASPERGDRTPGGETNTVVSIVAGGFVTGPPGGR